MRAYLSFKDLSIYKRSKGTLLIESTYPFGDEVTVFVTDLSKDKWQLPADGTVDVGNPKIKIYSREEFDKTFELLSVNSH